MIKNEMQLNDSLKKIKKIARPQETLDLEGGKKNKENRPTHSTSSLASTRFQQGANSYLAHITEHHHATSFSK